MLIAICMLNAWRCLDLIAVISAVRIIRNRTDTGALCNLKRLCIYISIFKGGICTIRSV